MDESLCQRIAKRPAASLLTRTSSIPTRDREYTGHAFTRELESQGIQISMDGKERAMDNIMAEPPMALCEIRGSVLERVPRREGIEEVAEALFRLLQ